MDIAFIQQYFCPYFLYHPQWGCMIVGSVHVTVTIAAPRWFFFIHKLWPWVGLYGVLYIML